MTVAIDSPCVHWFKIEPPAGPTSVGRCQRCGEEREFRNSEPQARSALRGWFPRAGQRAARHPTLDDLERSLH